MVTSLVSTNHDIAKVLEEIATLLEVQHANIHRIRAYRNAANQIRQSLDDIAELAHWDQGETLESLPGIGQHIARLIIEYVTTGKCSMLQRLQGEVTPEEIFEQVPGIGHELANRIVMELHLTTLEELDKAVKDGRLAKVKGFGRERIKTIQRHLAQVLNRYGGKTNAAIYPKAQGCIPSVSLLLDIDQSYRRQAAQDRLRRIAPRRFNPNNINWLPILHTEKAGWHFTVLFSNTLRAHKLGKIKDWVVIYYEKNGIEDRATVVTETIGSLKGKRVVRGRERETRAFYESLGLA